MSKRRKPGKPSPAAQPRKRSPVPPPGYVIGKTSYDREAEKEALEAEARDFLARQSAASAPSAARRVEQHVKKIRIAAGNVTMDAELNDSATAKALWDKLPITASAQTWGREVYFKIPLHADAENAQAKVPAGTVAFWPDGDCLCIFFGQTPCSPVNVVGKLAGNPDEFERVREGDAILLEKSE